MIKRQTITALICAAIAVILAIVYFSVVEPSLVPEEKPITPIELIDPLEVRTSDQTRVYLFPPLERARIDKIEVHNKNGGYTFYKSKGDVFHIEGMAEAPYATMALTYLVTTTGAGIASERYIIDDNTDLSVYGLSAKDDPAYYIVTDDKGTTHKVWVGKKAPTGDGYYCQYDGRKAVYLIRTAGFEVLLSDVYGILTPTLGLPVEQTKYTSVSLIGAIKNGVPLFEIKTLTPEENGSIKTEKPTYSYEFTFSGLKEFTPNDAMRDYVLSILSGLSGNKVVAYGEDITVDTLKTKYGIDISSPYYCIYYRYTEDATIYLSAPDKDGICYAYSSVYNTVVTIPLSSAPMYYLGVHDFVQSNIIGTSISLVTKVEIKGALLDEGITVDSAYGIKSVYDKEDNESATQYVWDINTGKNFTPDEVNNFKQIYGDIIRLYIEGEVDVTKIDDAEHLGSFTLTLLDGTSKRLDFYAYNNTRCYFTVNGVLNKSYVFYVNRDNVEKLFRDTYRFDLGYTIDPNV
jgi:hypothetical protein